MSSTVEITNHKLADGAQIPIIGLGTFRGTEESTLVTAVKEAIKAGYRHIDCAWVYRNEEAVGRALKEAIDESEGKIKREDLFITSKVWNCHHSTEQARVCLTETLKNLQLEYVDLYLVHWPFGFKEQAGLGPFPADKDGKIMFSDVHYMETYKALEEFQKEGKVKRIGISNFNIEQVKDVLDNCTIKPVVNQFEVNPYCQNDDLVDFCQKHGVAVEGYAPLGAGQKLDNKPDLPPLMEHPDIVAIGKKYNKTAAQVIIRWGIQRNIIMLAKSVTPSRIIENAQVFDFELTDEDMKKIKSINENARAYLLAHISTHPLYPFKADIKTQQ